VNDARLKKPALFVQGMHGLGDNLHQRAPLRQLMEKYDVTLESPWFDVYHDLVAQNLKIICATTRLRTQKKNILREARKFSPRHLAAIGYRIRVGYPAEYVINGETILGAMCRATDTDIARADYRLPIAPQWHSAAQTLIAQWKPTRPLLIFRPLTERREWLAANRNPDAQAYAALFALLRERFFVVGIADLAHGLEWLVGEDIDVDVRLYRGELEFGTLAALVAQAKLVYCSPGFMAVLAPAVNIPSIVIFGGYHDAASLATAARFAPYLGIDPIQPCLCYNRQHNCPKEINLDDARPRVSAFADLYC